MSRVVSRALVSKFRKRVFSGLPEGTKKQLAIKNLSLRKKTSKNREHVEQLCRRCNLRCIRWECKPNPPIPAGDTLLLVRTDWLCSQYYALMHWSMLAALLCLVFSVPECGAACPARRPSTVLASAGNPSASPAAGAGCDFLRARNGLASNKSAEAEGDVLSAQVRSRLRFSPVLIFVPPRAPAERARVWLAAADWLSGLFCDRCCGRRRPDRASSPPRR